MATRTFCHHLVQGYPETAREGSDAYLMKHLFRYYPTLNAAQRRDPMYRHWRRCVIVEMLKRGLIDKDPGPNNEPERR